MLRYPPCSLTLGGIISSTPQSFSFQWIPAHLGTCHVVAFSAALRSQPTPPVANSASLRAQLHTAACPAAESRGPATSLPAPQLTAAPPLHVAPLAAHSRAPATRRCPSRSSQPRRGYSLTASQLTAAPRLHAAARPAAHSRASAQPSLGYTSLTPPQLTAAPQLHVAARPEANTSLTAAPRRLHVAAHPAAHSRTSAAHCCAPERSSARLPLSPYTAAVRPFRVANATCFVGVLSCMQCSFSFSWLPAHPGTCHMVAFSAANPLQGAKLRARSFPLSWLPAHPGTRQVAFFAARPVQLATCRRYACPSFLFSCHVVAFSAACPDACRLSAGPAASLLSRSPRPMARRLSSQASGRHVTLAPTIQFSPGFYVSQPGAAGHHLPVPRCQVCCPGWSGPAHLSSTAVICLLRRQFLPTLRETLEPVKPCR